MQISRTYVSIATVVLVASAVVLGAQTRRERAAAPPTTELGTLARGWAALADGRAAESIKAADGILGRSPGSHRAVDLKIEALAATAPTQALDSYEAWLNRTRIEDVFLLVPIARGTLTQIADGSDRAIAMQARLRLAETGNPQDVAKLQEFMKTGTSGDSPAAPNPQRDLQLALQGDTSAATRLASASNAALGCWPRRIASALVAPSGVGPTAPRLTRTSSQTPLLA